MLLLALAVALSGMPVLGFGGVGQAAAQQRERPNLLDVLKRRGQNRKKAQPQRRTSKPRRVTRPQRATKQRKRAVKRRAAPRQIQRKAVTKRRVERRTETVAAPVETVEKIDNAKVVLVIGDFLAGGLADGLEEAFVELAGVRVEEVAEGSSGLVRDDYYDWPGTIGALLDTYEPAVVVVQLGANDRQAIRTPDGAAQPGTPEWTAAYRARATALADTVKKAGVPLVWVGAPAFRQGSLSTSMVTLNGIFEDVADGPGGSFVDIWDGFVDQNGTYVRTGPDVNGEVVRLRSKDGINFTSAGKRKMAFFVEKDVRRLLGGAVSIGSGTLNANNLAPLGDDLLEAPLQPRASVPIALTDASLYGGEQLLGGGAQTPVDVAPRTNPGLLAIAPDGPPPDRADNFAWPPARSAIEPAS